MTPAFILFTLFQKARQVSLFPSSRLFRRQRAYEQQVTDAITDFKAGKSRVVFPAGVHVERLSEEGALPAVVSVGRTI